MLCRLGLGLAPIAAEACALLRHLVGADAAALFWLHEDGQPAGFHHEDSPASVRNLFLNEPQLFNGPGETSVVALARASGQRVGRLLAPGAEHYRSNGHNLLMRPNGHHHTLDLRVEAGGRTRAVAALFKAPGPGFSDAQAALLERAGASLARAFGPSMPLMQGSAPQASGHVLLDCDGCPVMADAAALRMLQDAHLPGLGLYGAAAADLPAGLLRHLHLRLGEQRHIPVPGGMLHAHSHALQPLARAGSVPPQWLLTLQWQRPQQIDVVRRVLALPLTPLQREIAALAGLGHARADSLALTGVSNAALKKHLAAILDVAHARDWEDLAHTLQSSPP